LAATQNILLFGASVRALAFSALRAGLEPWCADLFNDQDLQARCPTLHVPANRYPEMFLDLAGRDLAGPWMYAGGLENQRPLVHQIARLRSLWGNDEAALSYARSPFHVAWLLRRAGIAHPEVCSVNPAVPSGNRWLLKPIAGAGGTGIRFWTGAERTGKPRKPCYVQQFIEGDPCAAVYVGQGPKGAQFLGLTRQLVGAPWLHAGRFQYCGSIGPIEPDAGLRRALEEIGSTVASGCGLRGLFGVDCILRDGVPYPVEINPRYSASIEVLEYATGLSALAWHRQIFDANAPAPSPASVSSGFVGKAILFTQSPLVFPSNGPWLRILQQAGSIQDLPAFADIPAPGERIEAGRPILSLFARDHSRTGCLDSLQQIAADLDRRLGNK
jgi:predicted ATP-grasp superfamily ATP-dependent carboligase